MTVADELIHLSDVQTLRVIVSSGERLEMESTWDVGGRPPPTHWHPLQHEHFEVLEGELTVELAGARQVLGPGEALDIPQRTAHRMWNAGSCTARATWVVTPALRTAEIFRRMAEGGSPLRRFPLLWTFRQEFRLAR